MESGNFYKHKFILSLLFLNRWRQQKVSRIWPGRFSRLLPRTTSWACWRCAWSCCSSWVCFAAASPSAWRRSWRTGREAVQGRGSAIQLPLQGPKAHRAPHAVLRPGPGKDTGVKNANLMEGWRLFRLVLWCAFLWYQQWPHWDPGLIATPFFFLFFFLTVLVLHRHLLLCVNLPASFLLSNAIIPARQTDTNQLSSTNITKTWFCFPAQCFYLLLMFESQELRLLISWRCACWQGSSDWVNVCLCLFALPSERICFVCVLVLSWASCWFFFVTWNILFTHLSLQ